jgi:hypothetical protein
MQRAARLGVIVCVIVAAVLGVVYFVKAFDELGDAATTNAAMNFDDREFGGGNSIVADKSALYEARARIPENETYRLLTGSSVGGETELTAEFVDQFARYFLMPRRPTPNAPWIICYACDIDALGPVRVAWDNGNGISILEVAE